MGEVDSGVDSGMEHPSPNFLSRADQRERSRPQQTRLAARSWNVLHVIRESSSFPIGRARGYKLTTHETPTAMDRDRHGGPCGRVGGVDRTCLRTRLAAAADASRDDADVAVDLCLAAGVGRSRAPRGCRSCVRGRRRPDRACRRSRVEGRRFEHRRRCA